MKLQTTGGFHFACNSLGTFFDATDTHVQNKSSSAPQFEFTFRQRL